MNRNVLLILIENRMQAALKVQEVLTKYGCSIKTRLGLHDAGPNLCASTGLIFLELIGEKKENENFESELSKIPGVSVKLVELSLK